jgi:hypothetical protein
MSTPEATRAEYDLDLVFTRPVQGTYLRLQFDNNDMFLAVGL